jgi:glycosyl transferase, family 25
MGIPVFVINLKRSVERRHHTTEQLNNLDVSFQIVEAIDGAELSDHEIRNNPDFGIYKRGLHSRHLLKKEIGCTLSHLKIYRQMVDEKIELAFILEDDNDYLKDIKDLLVNMHLYFADWDILYLGHHSGYMTKEAQSRKKKQLIPYNYFIGEAIELPYGSYAYIIKIEAAKKLLSRAYPIKIPFDLYIGNAPALGIRTFLLSPPCVFPNSALISTINNEQKFMYLIPFWEAVWGQIRKTYLRFPFLRTFGIWIFINRHFIVRYLRKTGIIKNLYAKY